MGSWAILSFMIDQLLSHEIHAMQFISFHFKHNSKTQSQHHFKLTTLLLSNMTKRVQVFKSPPEEVFHHLLKLWKAFIAASLCLHMSLWGSLLLELHKRVICYQSLYSSPLLMIIRGKMSSPQNTPCTHAHTYKEPHSNKLHEHTLAPCTHASRPPPGA